MRKMGKSAARKMFNQSIFFKIKKTLPDNRKLFRIEARLLLRNKDENIHEDPKTKDYRILVNLAKEALGREDFKGALFLAIKSLLLIKQLSPEIGNFDRAQMYELFGKIFQKNYRSKEAIKCYRRSFIIMNRTLGEKNMYSPMIAYELANSYLQNLMAEQAISYYKIFLRIKHEHIENLQEVLIKTIRSVSLAYYYIMEYKLALRILRIGLMFINKYFKKDKEYKASILLNMAMVYSRIKQSDKSNLLYKNAFRQLTNISKEYFYNEICEHYIKFLNQRGMHNRSLYLAKKLIKFLRATKGDKQITIAETYETISWIYKIKRKDITSDQYYHKCLILLRDILGTEHPRYLVKLPNKQHLIDSEAGNKKWLSYNNKAYKKLESNIGSHNIFTAKHLFHIGVYNLYFNLTQKSMTQLKKALELFELDLGKNSGKYLECLYYIGVNLNFQGYNDKALEIIEHVLREVIKNIGYFSEFCAIVLYRLAVMYHSKGRTDQSSEYGRRFIDVLDKLGIKNQTWLKKKYIFQADLFQSQGKLKHALVCYKKILDMSDKKKTSLDFTKNSAYNGILSIYAKYKDLDKVQIIRKKLLKLQISEYGLYSPTVLESMLSMARLSIRLEKYSEANRLYLKSKEIVHKLIKKGKIPEINLTSAEVYSIKAVLYFKHQKYEECLSLWKNILDLELKFKDRYDVSLCRIYENMLEACIMLKKFRGAIQMLKLLLKINSKIKNNFETMANCYFSIGNLYGKLKEFAIQQKYFMKCLRIFKTLYNKHSIFVKSMYHRIGVNLLFQRKIDQALRYLFKALSSQQVSENMKLIDICIWNSIGFVYSLEYKINEALHVINMCIKQSEFNRFPKIYIETFQHNYQTVHDLIDLKKHFNIKNDWRLELIEAKIFHLKFSIHSIFQGR